MKYLFLTLICSAVLIRPLFAQSEHPLARGISSWSRAAALASIDAGWSSESGDSKNDPGYKLYKEGYNLILQENWSDARKKFTELIDKYPKSDYTDDASYWNAYALKHTDKKQAIAAYQKFISAYPNSSYIDEALNDYLELNGGTPRSRTLGALVQAPRIAGTSRPLDIPMSPAPGVAAGPATAPRARTYVVSPFPSARMSDQKMRMAERQLSRQLARMAPMRATSTSHAWRYSSSMGEDYDEDTRLKMDALYAIGETKEDSISYKTLRDVAVDTKQPRVLRETAMDALANFTQYAVLPVFLEIARKDTSEEVQTLAIDYMGQLSNNKNKSFESLAELYGIIPKSRTSQRQTVLASIAEIGSDKAVEFLANVARTSDDYDLRSDAVYYLGNIGGEKARAALYDLLKGKE